MSATALKDFAATAEQISLHGLGFIQVKLAGSQRLHVWHPDLPRRSCFSHSAVHNHRFSFRSSVLIGIQVNRRYSVRRTLATDATHDVISHDGPRSAKGGRLSYVAGRARAHAREEERFAAGTSYEMPALQYHETPNDGVVVTLMRKLVESDVHACSLVERGYEFDQSFDRFQLNADELWGYVVDAFRSAG